jgi:hypothetical protein
LQKLKRAFDDAGLGWDEVRDLLGWERTEMRAGFGGADVRSTRHGVKSSRSPSLQDGGRTV